MLDYNINAVKPAQKAQSKPARSYEDLMIIVCSNIGSHPSLVGCEFHLSKAWAVRSFHSRMPQCGRVPHTSRGISCQNDFDARNVLTKEQDATQGHSLLSISKHRVGDSTTTLHRWALAVA